MPLYEKDESKIINNAFGGTSTTQKPIVRDGTGFYSHAICPTHSIKQKRPTYVMINKPGVYTFSYENTPTNYITGSILDDTNGPIKLDIQPTAWKRGDGGDTIGDITFVYVRVM